MATTSTRPAVSDNGEVGLPIQPIKAVPKAAAIRSFARALVNLGHSEDGALAIAQAVEDPSEARKQLGYMSSMRLPGGVLRTITTRLSALAVCMYPINPRVTGATLYPAAVTRTTGEAAKFWPHRDLKVHPDSGSELVIEAETRTRMMEALDAHNKELRAQNSLDESVSRVGVLMPITVLPMTVVTGLESADPVTCLTSPEGSSRVAAAQRLVGIRPSDPLYGPVSDLREAHNEITRLAGIGNQPASAVRKTDIAAARAAMLPASIIVQFEPDPGQGVDLLEALWEYLSLWHTDPPNPWSGASIHNTLGDDVLREIEATGEIDEGMAAYLGGMLTASEATKKGFSGLADERCAQVFRLMSRSSGTKVGRAIGRGITRNSVSDRSTQPVKCEIAAAVALRSHRDAHGNRRSAAAIALPRAFRCPPLWNEPWEVTGRTPKALEKAALAELKKGGPGEAARELAALAIYPLVTSGALLRGRSKGSGGDPRDPQDVLKTLIGSDRGIRVLGQAIADFRAGEEPRQIDEKGKPVPAANPGQFVPMNDGWVREQAQRPTATSTPTTPTATPPTPLQELEDRWRDVEETTDEVQSAVARLSAVKGDGGKPIIDDEGIDEPRVKEVTGKLQDVVATVIGHAAAWKRKHGQPPAVDEDDLDEGEEE